MTTPSTTRTRRITGTTLAHRYQIGDVVRQTTSTTVFEAVDTRIGARLEIEVLHAGASACSPAARSVELRAAMEAELEHPVVLAPIDVGLLEDETPFFVRRRRGGDTLDDCIFLSGPLAAMDIVRVGLDLLSALATAHERGFHHGALCPEHVAVIEREGVLLGIALDGFGTEPPLGDDHSTLGFSRHAFVAPERLDAATSTSAAPTVASDLYSLGAVLYFAATGTSPHSAGVFGPLPSRVARVIMRALHPQPEHRYASAQEMIGAFSALRDAALQPVMPPPPPARHVSYQSGSFLREENTITETNAYTKLAEAVG